MTRKQLEDLGLTKEQADSVMKINGDDIENAKGTTSTEIKNLQTEVEGLKTQVGDRDKQLETLKASAGDNADLKKKIEDLQTENATAKATHESELNQLKIDFAVEKALTGAKAKNIKAVKALLELGEAKLDKDGNVKGLDEQIEKLRSGDDTKFLFEAQRDLEMGTWNGRLVIIDDSLPTKVVEAVAEDTGKGIKAQDAYTEYTTYILGEGAIGFEDVGAKVPYEMVRDAKTRGGEDTLISRKRHAVSVSGVSYLKADQKTNSPTNTELGNGKNWSLVASDTKTIEHKAVPIARIISRG